MIYISAIFMIFLGIIYPASAFQNPVKNFDIAADFGNEVDGYYNTGIDFSGSQEIYASETGEIIFYSDDFIVLSHDSDICTLYYGLEQKDINEKSFSVSSGDKIGAAGDNTFHFEIYDREMKQYINPVLMTGGKKNSVVPEIEKVFLAPGRRVFAADNRQRLDPGTVDVCIALKNYGPEASPFRIQVFMNGNPVLDCRYRTISLADGKFVLDNTGKSATEYYGHAGMISPGRVELNSGFAILRVDVSDFYGNESSVSYQLDVK